MTGSTAAPPRRAFIVRHAEKPETAVGVQGVTVSGLPSEHSLTPRGWQRGGALAVLFGDPALAAARGVDIPTRLFSPDYGEHTSNRRTTETLTALAEHLELPLEHPVPVDQSGDLAAAALAAGPAPVLVCWEHHRIPDIIAGLLGDTDKHHPGQWPDDRFDLIWVLTLDHQRTPPTYTCKQVPQNLLAGVTTTTPA